MLTPSLAGAFPFLPFPGIAAASTLSLCYELQDGTKDPGCTDYCTQGETPNPHGLKEFTFTNSTDVCQTGGWGCDAVNDLCWRDECCNNDCTAAGGCTGATPDNNLCPKSADGRPGKCTIYPETKTCKCSNDKCDYTAQTGCPDNRCCIGPSQTSDSSLYGTCSDPANSKYSSKWLCAVASPLSWHECNETMLGKEITNLGVKYICSKTEAGYEWVESKTFFGSVGGYVAPTILVLFLAIVIIGKSKNTVKRKVTKRK